MNLHHIKNYVFRTVHVATEQALKYTNAILKLTFNTFVSFIFRDRFRDCSAIVISLYYFQIQNSISNLPQFHARLNNS